MDGRTWEGDMLQAVISRSFPDWFRLASLRALFVPSSAFLLPSFFNHPFDSLLSILVSILS